MRRSGGMRLAIVIVLALALAAPAEAATWSPPEDVSTAHQFIDAPALVVARNGRALATWRFGDPERTRFSAASRAPGAARFGATRPLTRPSGLDRLPETVEGIAAYGRRRVLLASTRPAGRGPTARLRLEVRFGRADGTFGRRRTMRRPGRSFRAASRIADVSLAVNARGDAALAWSEDRGVRTDRVYVALRRAGHGFGKPRRLVTGRVRSVSAAIGPSGDVLVAWASREVVRARFKGRGRRSFAAAQTIRSEDAAGAQMDAVVNAGGRAVLVWSAQRATEGGERGPVFFQGAVRPAGAQRFRRAELLERMDTEAGLGRLMAAGVDPTGNVVVAWSGSDGTSRRVRVSQADQAGRFTAPADVSAPGADALLSDLEVGPTGRAIVVWDGGVEDPASVVRAAVAPTVVQPFGPPEDVSPPGQDARFAVAAFDPRSGVPTILFSNRPAGGSSSRTLARAATRSE
jgi:hypothetical protein